MNVNDEVTINAVIIGMTESGNPIIKTPKRNEYDRV